jgi:hypothetical protein
LSDF